MPSAILPNLGIRKIFHLITLFKKFPLHALAEVKAFISDSFINKLIRCDRKL